MARNVKGTLFVDYVKTIRSNKEVDWSAHLLPEDLRYLNTHERILPSSWYPFETYERMGMAIFREIIGGNLEMVRLWGKTSTDNLMKIYHYVMVDGDPAASAEKFDIMRAGFFDFPGARVKVDSETSLRMTLTFSSEPAAAEAQAYQGLGLIERLLELAGATDISHEFTKCAWKGDSVTVIALHWRGGG